MNNYYIAWWNLENLFDVFGSAQRPDWLQKTLKNELKGWTQEVLEIKIWQLAKIICRMNENKGPDILGVCEVENQNVLQMLVDKLSGLNRNYAVAHHDTNDKRGIDVAFIYDNDKFSPNEQFSYEVLKRTATRDIFQVNFTSVNGNKLILIGNHWPARIPGSYQSEPYRIIAAETLSYWMERILEIYSSEISVLIMGDFNDEPFNRSIVEYALSTNLDKKVINSRSPRLLNLMWPFMGDGYGSFYYQNFPFVFDQILVSKGLLLQKGKFHIAKDDNKKHKVKIVMQKEMQSTGRYPSPIRFSRPAKKDYNPDGFSDHYPVSVVVEEKI